MESLKAKTRVARFDDTIGVAARSHICLLGQLTTSCTEAAEGNVGLRRLLHALTVLGGI